MFHRTQFPIETKRDRISSCGQSFDKSQNAFISGPYTETGFPIMLLTILIAGVYLVVRFPPA